MKKILFIVLFLFLLSSLVWGATIKGTIYNDYLEAEPNVLVEVNSQPQQQYLAKNGEYQFDLPSGSYTITAVKNNISATEEITVVKEGDFILDMFLLPNFQDEEELFQETQEEILTEDYFVETRWWAYAVLAVVVLFLLYRIYQARKRYGPLSFFRRKMKVEQAKTIEEHKADLVREPGYLDKTVEIIKKHEGRITQKELRKELLYLSEAKISLILTELEHNGKIEKVKQGRGNVILWK